MQGLSDGKQKRISQKHLTPLVVTVVVTHTVFSKIYLVHSQMMYNLMTLILMQVFFVELNVLDHLTLNFVHKIIVPFAWL